MGRGQDREYLFIYIFIREICLHLICVSAWKKIILVEKDTEIIESAMTNIIHLNWLYNLNIGEFKNLN